MTAIQISITSKDYEDPDFSYYEFFGSQTNLALADVADMAEYSDIAFSTHFLRAGLVPGDTWYHWVRWWKDNGTRSGAFLALGPVLIVGLGADQLSDHSVTYAKIQNVTAGNVLGSVAGGTVEEIPISSFAGAVDSVAGKTGVVTLQVADIADMTANGRSLVAAADYAAMRALLGVGSDDVAHGTISNAASQIIALPSDYDSFELVFSNIVAVTGGAHVLATFSTDGGSTYNSTDNIWGHDTIDASSTKTQPNSGGATSSIRILSNVPNNVLGCGFTLEMPWPTNTTNYKEFVWEAHARDSVSSVYTRVTGIGALQVLSSAITHVKIAMSSGNISAGRWVLYGRRGPP